MKSMTELLNDLLYERDCYKWALEEISKLENKNDCDDYNGCPGMSRQIDEIKSIADDVLRDFRLKSEEE